MADEANSSGSPFWRFSLRFYRAAGVADACIALQDQAGVDVNLLLFLLWNASEGRRLSAAEVAELESKVGAWREAAVIPLRALRRALKVPPAVIEPGTAEAFRTRIKQVELEAERLQQEATYALAQSMNVGAPAPTPAEAARANVAAYQAILPRPLPPTALETLFAAFTSLAAQAMMKAK